MRKKINNIRDNHHLNSKYWQDYKKSLPKLPKEIFDIAVGMILGDATMYKVSREAYIKFEQGYTVSTPLFKFYATLFLSNCNSQTQKGLTKRVPLQIHRWFKISFR